MGSIVMHLCASNEANKILNLDNNKFLIGSIAPDIHKIKNGPKANSHYLQRFVIDGKKYELPDLEKFVEENKNKIKEDSFVAGYYAHLIADKIWYIEVANKYELSENKNQIKLPNDSKYIQYKEFQKMMYDDYTKINNYLINKYRINIDYLYDLAILNIEKSELQELMCMNDNKDVMDELNLSILDLEEVLNWIEKSKNEIVCDINKMI